MHNHKDSVAILIDGGFFLKRYFSIFDKPRNVNLEQVAKDLYTLAHKHVGPDNHLYRIFYYDCIPFDKRVHNPITKKVYDFKKTEQYKFRMELFEQLKKKRKVALRLGVIKDSKSWSLNPEILKELIAGKIDFANIKDTDITYNLRQKGIDMKIGVDIASLALKQFVNQIVLISGDADFVPASKLARREGIDFILDPMWNNIDDTLLEHIDGLRSTCPKPVINLKTRLAS
ncbi:MAG: NYN domain-containing protein [Chitinophagaceae bacterium]|nr:NYN domain-containing protein [Chitinophagaceae bacterium]